MQYAIHGTTDEITVCACCGKKNLRNTVVLEFIDGVSAGELLHFGSHCAARALGQKKSNSDIIIKQAKRRQSIEPIVQFIKSNIHHGIEAIKSDARKIAASAAPGALVNGFDSWGQMNIHFEGINVEIKA